MGVQSADYIANDKNGTVWTAVAHIFCAVVGAGVLGLPNSVAWLGWVAGPICLVVFFVLSLWSSHLLAQLYCVDGIEFARYHHAVQHILGNTAAKVLAVFQATNLVMVNIAYSITGAISMQQVALLIGSSFSKEWQLVLVMGALELVLSQVPSLEEIWWVSAIGTISSLGYVFIALILGLIYSGAHGGSVGGRHGGSDANKAFNVLSSLGNIAFAYTFALVLLEIQDTLRQPPPAQRSMRMAVRIAVTAAFGFYFSTAVTCYSALGNDVPGEVLQGFEDAPNWVMVVANILVVVHMVMAWQVFAQPVFETIESNVKAFVIKRRQRANNTGTGAEAAPKHEVTDDADHKPSPFDRPASTTGPHPHHELHVLPPVAEGGDLEGADVERTVSGLTPAQSGSVLRSRGMSARTSAGMVIVNSAPIPDLLPSGGWKPPRRVSMGQHSDNAPGQLPAGLARHSAVGSTGSALSRLSVVLGSTAMYHLDTGAANEHVPMNDQGYYLPFWQRLLLRSTYVALCTMVAVVMPFFNAITGLVGAVMFWPLSIAFPFAMYIKVYKIRGFYRNLMLVVSFFMLLVGIAAAIASMRSLIVTWSSYTFFS